ncbi:hypothetical protein AGMMS49965_09950 [Bacteroidia bacterium]|nr:hypothetical protein AGMMS49965_09950 [Bacteroidia bacterium]
MSTPIAKKGFQILYGLGATVIILGVLGEIMHWPGVIGHLMLNAGFITEAFIFAMSAFEDPPAEHPHEHWETYYPTLLTDPDDILYDGVPVVPPIGAGGGGGGGGVASAAMGVGVGFAAGVAAPAAGGAAPAAGGVAPAASPAANGETPAANGETPEANGAAYAPPANGNGNGNGYANGNGNGNGYAPPPQPNGYGTSHNEPDYNNFVSGNFGSRFDSSYYDEVIEQRINKRVGRRASGNVERFISEEDNVALSNSINRMVAAAEQFSQIMEDMQRVRVVSTSLMDFTAGLTNSTNSYFEQLDSLSRNVQGLNNIYERQIQTISTQIDSINQINVGLRNIKDLYDTTSLNSTAIHNESERMAQQLQDLNSVYGGLLSTLGDNRNFSRTF